MNVSALRKLVRLRKVPQSQCTSSYSIICIFKYDVIHAMPPHYRLSFHSPHPHKHSSHNRAGKIVLGTNVAVDSPTFNTYYLILLNLIVSKTMVFFYSQSLLCKYLIASQQAQNNSGSVEKIQSRLPFVKKFHSPKHILTPMAFAVSVYLHVYKITIQSVIRTTAS